MADYNDAVLEPGNFILTDKVCLDPTTVLTPPPTTIVPGVNTMTVANGSVVSVYDVTNPSSPILIGTIG
jgi:hypothetical protein